MHQVEAIGDLNRRAGALLRDLTESIDTINDPLLAELSLADDLIHLAERMRTLLLTHARKRGQSWSAISTATRTPPSTWRDRHGRAIREGTT